ncbi:MAG TPA: hypothetical protein VMN43_10720, partial [Aestuariivirgaceae bacterium]|nr:hypothetical protein [Aestuariivirgaceae bacterium]
GDAAEHRVDAALLGQSLQGTARLYNSVAHFWFYGDVPKRLVPTIRIAAGPPQRGSLMYFIYLIMTHGQLAVFPSLLFEFADLAMPAIVKAIFAGMSRLMLK